MSDMWSRVREFKGPFIDPEYRRCSVCGERALNGVLKVERGYSVGFLCEKCELKSRKRVHQPTPQQG
jgi:hypothetical protein